MKGINGDQAGIKEHPSSEDTRVNYWGLPDL